MNRTLVSVGSIDARGPILYGAARVHERTCRVVAADMGWNEEFDSHPMAAGPLREFADDMTAGATFKGVWSALEAVFAREIEIDGKLVLFGGPSVHGVSLELEEDTSRIISVGTVACFARALSGWRPLVAPPVEMTGPLEIHLMPGPPRTYGEIVSFDATGIDAILVAAGLPWGILEWETLNQLLDASLDGARLSHGDLTDLLRSIAATTTLRTRAWALAHIG